MENEVEKVFKKIRKANYKTIDNILADYQIPSHGELDMPGCYIQTTPRYYQEKKKEKNDIVFIPLGSTEVHGPHSSPGQDTTQVARIIEGVRRYTKIQGRECNLAWSPWNYGNHPAHHMGMQGTVPVAASTLKNQLIDVMFGLWADGYRKQIFINNHAQHWVITDAIHTFRQKYPQLPIMAFVFDWCVAVKEFFYTKDRGGPFEDDFIHADEAETSIMLLLAPEFVDMKYAVDTKPKGYMPPGHLDKSADAHNCPNRWYSAIGQVPHEVNGTPEGVVGRATIASAKKAKKAVAAALEYLTLLHDTILDKYPPGKLPPIEEITLFKKEDVEGYMKKPGEPGYKNPFQLWRPSD